jgi:hypothetical protein
MPSAPAPASELADAARAARSEVSNANTVLVISAGSRPTRSQCLASTSNLCRTEPGSPANTLHASPYLATRSSVRFSPPPATSTGMDPRTGRGTLYASRTA